jgi:hypothetical protein
MSHLVLPLFYNEILYLNPFKRIEEVTPDIIIFIYTSHFFRQKEYIYVAYACDRTTTPAGMQMHLPHLAVKAMEHKRQIAIIRERRGAA